MVVNAQYNIAKPRSIPIRIAAYQRRKMFEALLRVAPIQAGDQLLDIGVTSDRSYDHSNYLEAWYPIKQRITAIGIDDASFLTGIYPGLNFVRGDGRNLPFAEGSFDFVHASAVLEHVGSRQNQEKFLREMWRVTRKGIFVTTPNRWFPIEFHTLVPLLHWLPAPRFRAALAAMGQGFLASEDNLNLLSRRELTNLAHRMGIERFEIGTVSLLGWPTNLLLYAMKQQTQPGANAARTRTA
jgi:hypothetical protein